ncbi:hypothetical protein DL767_010138 [Monosporascus sp. MG133]|nr:hypothetical protein DL767_010138 [Monosporascus sp. MG133]
MNLGLHESASATQRVQSCTPEPGRQPTPPAQAGTNPSSTTVPFCAMNRSFFRSFRTQITPLPHPTGDFTSKTIIVTGANVGLGLEAARHFVRLNASKVILACRNIEKGEQAKSDIEASEARPGVVEVWQVDLGSFASVQSFCRRANGLERLDVVIENAALQTATHQLYEGYERSVTVHIISTYLMALLLLPAMRRTATRQAVHS